MTSSLIGFAYLAFAAACMARGLTAEEAARVGFPLTQKVPESIFEAYQQLDSRISSVIAMREPGRDPDEYEE